MLEDFASAEDGSVFDIRAMPLKYMQETPVDYLWAFGRAHLNIESDYTEPGPDLIAHEFENLISKIRSKLIPPCLETPLITFSLGTKSGRR